MGKGRFHFRPLPLFRVAEEGLAEVGFRRIRYADRCLGSWAEYERLWPKDDGTVVVLCVPIVPEYGALVLRLQKSGYRIFLASSNPFLIDNEVASALVQSGISVFGILGQVSEECRWCMEAAAENAFRTADSVIVVDECGDLITHCLKRRILDKIHFFGMISGGPSASKVLKRRGQALPCTAVSVPDSRGHALLSDLAHPCDEVEQLLKTLISDREFGQLAVFGFPTPLRRGLRVFANYFTAMLLVEDSPLRILEAASCGFVVVDAQQALSRARSVLVCDPDYADRVSRFFATCQAGVRFVCLTSEVWSILVQELAKSFEQVSSSGQSATFLSLAGAEVTIQNLAERELVDHSIRNRINTLIIEHRLMMYASLIPYMLQHPSGSKGLIVPPNDIENRVAATIILKLNLCSC